MIPIDKQKHFLAGLLGASITAAITSTWWVPLAVATALGVAKEAADWAWNRYVWQVHEVSIWDALATAAGGILPTLYRLLF